MRPTVGIICEYDPFHRGHARQFALVREKLPDARIVCVMSGCFTQRGSAALFAPAFRARAALEAGASLVLELPCAFALREAENFALGGVAMLDRLGFVTHVSFGSEDDDLPFLQAAAALLEAPTPAFTAALHAALAQGKPFAAAQALAVAAGLQDRQGCGEPSAAMPAQPCAPQGAASHTAAPMAHTAPAELDATLQALRKPNNILGICYLRALQRLGSQLTPLPVRRIGNYHAPTLAAEGFPSATATRKAYLGGDIGAAVAACGYPLAGAAHHPPTALDAVLLHTVRAMDACQLRALPDCTEGLEHRLARAAQKATDRATLLALLKTRRYAHARLNRLLSHAMLGVTAEMLAAHPLPGYARLLGFRQADAECLRHLRHSGIPILAKAAHGDNADPLFQLDRQAYDLWALGAGLPAGMMLTQPIAIV